MLLAICSVESDWRNVAKQDGPTYSYGVCQVKLATARWVSGNESIGEHDLMDPLFNLYIASLYLQYQLDRYSGDVDRAISAYNAGHAVGWNKAYVQKVKRRIKR